MTIPWQPGNQGAMVAPPGFVDPHDYGNTVAAADATFADEPAGTLAAALRRRYVPIATLAALTTGGQVAVRAIPLPAGLVVSNIAIFTGTTAASGPTHLWFGLTDANLNVLGVTADQGAAAQAASTLIKLALAAPVTILTGGLYYVAVSSSASTTAPTLSGANLATGLSGVAPVICGTAGTQAAPPAVGAQLNAGTIASNASMHFAAWLS